MACCNSGYTDEEARLLCARLLLSHGADVNAQDKHKATALIEASSHGLKSIVRELLNVEGVDINLQDKEGWTVGISH